MNQAKCVSCVRPAAVSGARRTVKVSAGKLSSFSSRTSQVTYVRVLCLVLFACVCACAYVCVGVCVFEGKVFDPLGTAE